MPIGIQLGEIGNRLRRLLDVRGRIPTQLDEIVVPVVIVGDGDQVPFSLDPAHCAGNQDVTGDTGIQATIAVVNDGPEGSVFLVDQLAIAAGATGQRVEISRSGVLVADVPADTNNMADLTNEARPGATGRDVPVRLHRYSAATPATVGSICEIVAAPSLTTQGSLVLPVKHYLRRGEVMYVKHLSTAQRLILGVAGRYYQNLSDTGR